MIEACKHKSIVFESLKAEGVKEYRKYVGTLDKCKKCGKYIGYKSLKYTNSSVAVERAIKNANNKKI